MAGLLVGITAIFVVPPYFAQDDDDVILPYLVETGISYFSGDKLLANGGRPCVECHNIKSMELIGNDFAPDLSDAFLEPPNWFEVLPDFILFKIQPVNNSHFRHFRKSLLDNSGWLLAL